MVLAELSLRVSPIATIGDGNGHDHSARPHCSSKSIRMEADESEIFEVEDYTIASPLERVVADVEKILRDWGLASGKSPKESKTCQILAGGKHLTLSLQIAEPCGGDGGAAAAARAGT